MRSITCVTPSVSRTRPRARCFAAVLGALPSSRTTPALAVTSMPALFTWASDDNFDCIRVVNDASSSDFCAGGGCAAAVAGAAADGGAAITVRLSSTRFTPSVVRASSRASPRSFSLPT